MENRIGVVGIVIEEKLSIGTVAIRIITRKDATKLIEGLKKKKCGITVVDAEGPKGNVKLIFTIVNRQNIQNVINIVKKYNPKSFYSIEDIRHVSEALPSHGKPWYKLNFLHSLKNMRKSK